MEYALTVNLWSTFWCSRQALGHMIPQQWGRIINISSLEGKVGKPGIATYVTAKHAVNGLTKAMAHEVGTLGITVNALCPGAIETDMMKDEGTKAAESMGMAYEELLDWFAQESAIKRLNDVEDVADGRVAARVRGRRRHHRLADLDRRRHGAVLTGGTRWESSMERSPASRAARARSAAAWPRRSSREGAKVVVNGRNADKGKQCLAEMGGGDNADFYAGDAAVQADVEGLIDFTIDRYGQLDICCLNSGGVLATAPVAQMTDEEWKLEIDWNLNHVFWGMRRALQHMIPRDIGPHPRDVVGRGQARQAGHPRLRGHQARRQRAGRSRPSKEVGTHGHHRQLDPARTDRDRHRARDRAGLGRDDGRRHVRGAARPVRPGVGDQAPQHRRAGRPPWR